MTKPCQITYLTNSNNLLRKTKLMQKSINQAFQKQANQQLFQNHTWIELKFVLTHDDVTNQKQTLPKDYIQEVENAIILWNKIHGIPTNYAYTREGSSIDLINEDGKITYKISYNLLAL